MWGKGGGVRYRKVILLWNSIHPFSPDFGIRGHGDVSTGGNGQLHPPAKRQEPTGQVESRRIEQIQRWLVTPQNMRLNQFDGFALQATADLQQQSLSVSMATLRLRHKDLPDTDAPHTPFGDEQIHADDLAGRYDAACVLFVQFEPERIQVSVTHKPPPRLVRRTVGNHQIQVATMTQELGIHGIFAANQVASQDQDFIEWFISAGLKELWPGCCRYTES